MAVVTALRATRHGGVALHVDDEFVCTISEAAVARWRLFKGRELDDDTLALIVQKAAAARVLADAYRLLGHRARARQELRARLLAKEHSEAAVDEALQALQADGLLDDAAFARSYAADKRRLSGWGAQRISRGLATLGVAQADIEAALAGADWVAMTKSSSGPSPCWHGPAHQSPRSRRLGAVPTSCSYDAALPPASPTWPCYAGRPIPRRSAPFR